MAGDKQSASYRILAKLAYLLSARWVREALQAVFFIYLARVSAATYGEFMLALGLGSILVLVGEFGLNLPLVGLLSRRQDTWETLMMVSLLKGWFLLLGALGALVFLVWQDYSPALKQVMLVIGAGVGLEALASTFFVALQVEGRQQYEGATKVVGAALGFGYGLITLALGAPPLVIACFKLIETIINISGGAAACLPVGKWRLPKLAFSRLGAMAQSGMLFALIEVTAVFYNKANLFFLQRYGGSQGVAQYSVTWQMVDGFSCLASNLLLQSVLFPLFVKLWEVDRGAVSRLAQDTARWLLLTALALMFVLAVESDRLITLIYGPQYPEAVWMQKYLVVTIVFAFLHNLAAFLMISMRLERLLLVFYLAGLVLNLLWCALVIPVTPLWGASWAMIVTKGGVALLTVSYIQKRLRLMPFWSFLLLVLAALGGLALYFLAKPYLPREGAEFLALLPLLGLAVSWWRQRLRLFP